MSLAGWIIVFLSIQVIHFLATWKLYQKAGRKPWEALVPIYNAVVLLKIIQKPTWWVALLFLPVINNLMIVVLWIQTLKAFGRVQLWEKFAVVLTLGFYLFYVSYATNVTYQPIDETLAKKQKDSFYGSIVFAIIVATFVHTYMIQPFTIPTSSLEKTLLVGDFLFVSKMHYGARTPSTTFAVPMLHDSIPIIKTKSYLSYPSLPSFRLPGFESVKRGEIVVFNWPQDTVYKFFDLSGKRAFKPLDKKSNYVKRCVGLPGDVLEIKQGDLYINNQPEKLHDRQKIQLSYKLKIIPEQYQSVMDVVQQYTNEPMGFDQDKNLIVRALTEEEAALISKHSGILEIKKNITQGNLGGKFFFKYKPDVNDYQLNQFLTGYGLTYNRNPETKILTVHGINEMDAQQIMLFPSVDKYRQVPAIFPHGSQQLNWTQDNLGPIQIPKKGDVVNVTGDNLYLYHAIIKDYEQNDLRVEGNQVYINNQLSTTYTIKQDYYWMMGDNRHNSEDSRYWGFVPQENVLGKPVFIWMSLKNMMNGFKNWSIRTERLFTTVHGSGEPKSYFNYFLVLLALYFGWDFYRGYKKKKDAKNKA